ncbi:MAG: leucine-rich repeat protein [Ruminococcus callidus]
MKNLVDMNAIQTIGDNAFEGCTSLVNVVLPDTLTKLGVAAFRSSCSGLTAVKSSGKLTELPEAVFYKCVALSTGTQHDLSNCPRKSLA